MHCANDGAGQVRRVVLQRSDPCPLEWSDDSQDRCSPYAPRMVELDAHQLVREVLRPINVRACQPKKAHATSAKATVMAAATNQISVLRATRFRVGLNPMLFSIAVIATKATHRR